MKKAPYLQYLRIPRSILKMDLTLSAKMIYAYIQGYFYKPNQRFNSSNEFIASELCMPITSVKRALKELEQKDFIKIEKIEHLYGKSNRIIYDLEDIRARKAIEYFNKTYGKK